MTTSFSTDENDWQSNESLYENNFEYVEAHVDKDRRFLYGVDKENNFIFGCGIPSAIKKKCNYITVDKQGNGDYGTFDHAITMINCCDEKSGRLPQFIDCGKRTPLTSDYPNEEARQSIRLLDFVVELNPVSIWDGAPLIRMKELNPGQFCGYINFTAGGVGKNSRDVQIWENDGSGVNFKTENSTHAKGGTTAERNTYYAQYMQHYYDTDLNKELICIDPATQKWVDCLGNIVT